VLHNSVDQSERQKIEREIGIERKSTASNGRALGVAFDHAKRARGVIKPSTMQSRCSVRRIKKIKNVYSG
jgi:hypothetical protein